MRRIPDTVYLINIELSNRWSKNWLFNTLVSYIESEASKDRRWQLGVDAFLSGDLAGAMYLFKALERDGDEAASIGIATIYEVGGSGVDQDYEQALKWYERALYDTDHPIAYLALGWLYYCGLGVNVDYKKAYSYFSSIENEGQPAPLCMLGRMFQNGQGVEKDIDKAVEYYQKAIDCGHLLAVAEMGWLQVKRGEIVIGFATLLKILLPISKIFSDGKDEWRIKIEWKPSRLGSD